MTTQPIPEPTVESDEPDDSYPPGWRPRWLPTETDAERADRQIGDYLRGLGETELKVLVARHRGGDR